MVGRGSAGYAAGVSALRKMQYCLLNVCEARKAGIMLNLNNDHLLILAKTAVNPD